MSWWTIGVVVALGATLALLGSWLHAKEEPRKFLGAALVFAGCVVPAHLVPLIVFPWPMLSAQISEHHWKPIVSMPVAWLIDFAQWSLVTIAFAAATKRLRTALLVPVALPSIYAIVWVVFFSVPLTGLKFYWHFSQ